MLKRIFQVISLLLILYLGLEFWNTYISTHSYYTTMMADGKNWNIVLSGLLFSLLPGLYLVYAKRVKILPLLVLFFGGLVLFGMVFTTTKGGLGGWPTLILNSAILFALAVFMLTAFIALGEVVKHKVLGLKTTSVLDVLLNMGVGLSIFLLLNYLLINLNIFFPRATWLQVVGVICLMFYKRDSLKETGSIIAVTVQTSSLTAGQKGALLFMFCLTCLYLYLGFYLSDIAYSTAWDANHAYMFYPKMRALNNGYYWDEGGMVTGFQLRYAFIAFWFSLFSPTAGILGISADTIAISMNFWSGFFVIIFGLGLIAELLLLLGEYTEKHANSFWIFLSGRLLFLLRLTSGMGAFLVFVDNKTDLGVMALIILALYSGIIAFRSIQVKKKGITSTIRAATMNADEQADKVVRKRGLTKNQAMLLMLSGFFYAIAALAKQTALFDVANFGIFAFWMRIGPLGAAGILVALLGGMAALKFRGIDGYIGSQWGTYLLGVGGFAGVSQSIYGMVNEKRRYLGYLIVWLVTFLGVYLLFKVPFHAAKLHFYPESISPGKFIERVLFTSTPNDNGNDSSGLAAHDFIPVYAQLGAEADTCTLQTQGLSSADDLYEGLLPPPGDTYNEDVGRYVGFGWKGGASDQRKGIAPFIDPWWGFLFLPGCRTINPILDQAKESIILCNTEVNRKGSNASEINEIISSIESQIGVGNSLLSELLDGSDLLKGDAYDKKILELEARMQNHSIKVVINTSEQKEIYFPYNYLNFFNITFNRSLQNLSSYYTDIGIIRLLLIIFSFVGLLYGIFTNNRLLTGLQAVTLFGWITWFFIGGGILRYAIGIIVWSIMAFVAFIHELTGGKNGQGFGWMFVVAFALIGLLQLTHNFVRVASQGGSGPFMRYKSNTGLETIYTDSLQRQSVTNNTFGKEDIFDLQFPHYRSFIQAMNESSADEGALIAGTYSRYFVEDQSNVRYDQFLTWMRQMTSDGDMCNTYLRMKDQNKKYIVIDPNIGTVVQGSGNQSLFDRFFARLDTDKGEILDDGVMTSLARMVEQGYLEYFSTNNLGAKYAYILPNSSFGQVSEDERILARGRLSVPRFWGTNALSNIMSIAEQRINDGSFLEDLADMTGKNIRILELRKIISTGKIDGTAVGGLSQDERAVLVQYINLRTMKQDAPDAFKVELEKFIKSNIQSGSQIIVLEVK